MFDTFDFMAFNWCCILGAHITLLYPIGHTTSSYPWPAYMSDTRWR